jgi:deoxyribonuclease-4
MLKVGGHLHGTADEPLTEVRELGADIAQAFLGDPQGWQKPPPRPDLAAVTAAGVDLYVHAPYVVNVASMNNRIRIPSRKILEQHLAGAAEVGAKALIVHAGHVRAGEEVADGIENWRKAVRYIERPLPVYIENTAGGDNALARSFEMLARLFDAVGDAGLGFCLDTCHAHAAGEPLDDIVDRLKSVTGRVDLVHANDSRDPFGSGRDRHTNIGRGEIGAEPILAVVGAAGVPVICETPPAGGGQAADIALLRSGGA